MSHTYYLNLWREAQDNLKQNIEFDREVKKKGAFKDTERAKWMIGHLFMNYVRIVNKLDECYDQIIHPQKREVIGRLLDTSLGRLLEIKRDLVLIEMDDYMFFDNVLMELKLTPQDVEIRVPQYFWRDREKSRAHRRELIKQVYEDIKKEEFKEEYLKNVPEEEREEVWEAYLEEQEKERIEKEKMAELLKKRLGMAQMQNAVTQEEKQVDQELVDAILVIQRHERARQSRRQLPQQKRNKMLRQMGVKEVKIGGDAPNQAATVIQRHWRRHRRRVLAERRHEREMLLLGMIIPSWKDMKPFEKIAEVIKKRREMQDRNQEEYENSLETIKEKMTKLYSASMNEDITDEIRYWFEWFFLQTDFLPDFPDDEPIVPTGEILGIPKKISKEFIEKTFPVKKGKGPKQPLPKTRLGLALSGIQPLAGSALVVAEHWIGPKEFLICQKELERMKKSGKKGGEKKKLSKEEKAALKKKEKEAERRRLLAEEAEGFRLKDSDFLMPLAKADKDYRDFWLDLDESNNYEQRYIYELVKNDKCWELSMQVRQAVDEVMRLELEILKDALERDKHPKKKKKKKKKKKPKKKKKKKKKVKKDPTGDRTVDELFIELFRNGIIREYDEAHLRDYIGERSFNSFELRRRLEDGPPGTGDVRELILQLCILPLGSSRIHQLSPVIRSVCLIGPEHSGKEFLARIVCTETASVMFDLTPENTVGKYPGKEVKMLLHLVEKMSRILQPSIIFIDGAEKLFYKKVPKEEKQFEPKRLGKTLSKIVKGIKAEDQVLVLGVSSFPWLCPRKKLRKTYDKFIYVPQPDYGTYYILWQKLLTPYHSLPREFDFSCLAKVSKGYSIKLIMDVVQQVLNPERISRSRLSPYKPVEFMEEIVKVLPLPDKILKKCNKFYDKTDLRKKRLERLKVLKDAKEKEKKK